MARFEELLAIHRDAVERYVRFRLPTSADADDVFQEVCLTACQRFDQLKNQDSFKGWMVSIARNKCIDYFRRETGRSEVSLDDLPEQALSGRQYGAPEHSAVSETLDLLDQRDREILDLCFWEELPQAEIARRLNVPLGTVKSRLHAAKQRFKSKYPCPVQIKEGKPLMKKLPEYLPEYNITEQKEAPFSVKWEELMGWFLVPRLGEKLSWGMYDLPNRKYNHIYEMAVTGRAEVHGIMGVELTARESSYSRKEETIERLTINGQTYVHWYDCITDYIL